MTTMTRRIGAGLAAATLAVGLVACGDSGDTTTATTTVATQADDAGQAAPAAQPGTQQDMPSTVSGYTDEARNEMAEDNLTEADIEDVVARVSSGEGEAEWDDDGYWEYELDDIDVDIQPDGLVLEVDR